jgi:hypothetical protein
MTDRVFDSASGRGAGSRIAGRGALLRSLRALLRRVQRFGEHRAASPEEQVWTARLHDRLSAAFADGTSSESARASLAAYDRRRARSMKASASRPSGVAEPGVNNLPDSR